MATAPKVTILESSQIAPPPGSLLRSSFPLTFFDVKLLFSTPVERIFFFQFPHSTSHFLHSALPTLKSSLSLTLQQFPPLAGKIRRRPETGDAYEIIYIEDTDFVQLIAAEIVSDEFEGFCSDHARDINKVLLLLPELPNAGEDQPLLASQATVFPGRGIAIGVAMHHAVCDGSGFTHFVSSWAAAFRGGGGSTSGKPRPVLDRTMISDPHGLSSIYSNILSSRAGTRNPTGRNSNTDQHAIATFNLTGEVIQKLKSKLQAKADNSLHVSSITVAYACVWISLAKTQRFEADKMAYLIFAANCRSIIKPPVPETYFGNCLSVCQVNLMAGDLLDEGDGFVNAAVAVGREIQRFKGMDVVGEDLKATKAVLQILSEQPMIVGGSNKFGVYEIDFGWGRPEKVEMTSIMNRGIISVQESRGGGGIEIGLVLPMEEMDDFDRNFSNGLNFL